MADDDRKRLKGKEVSSSSPDYFRQDTKEEARREVEKGTKQENVKLQKLRLKMEMQKQKAEQKTQPSKERAINIMGSDEKAGSAKEFVEKEQVREEAREEAQAQGAPESTSEEQG